jgi:hypothetical protein
VAYLALNEMLKSGGLAATTSNAHIITFNNEVPPPLHHLLHDDGVHPPLHVRRRHQRQESVGWGWPRADQHDWVLEPHHRLAQGQFGLGLEGLRLRHVFRE